MAQQSINLGTVANDGTGDSLRVAFDKCNDNFTELYNRVRSAVPSTMVGSAGDKKGDIAVDSSYVYVCYADYSGSNIWKRISLGTF